MGVLFLMNQAYINLYQSFFPALFLSTRFLTLLTVPCVGSVRLTYSWGIDIRLEVDRRWDIKLTTAFDYFY